MHLKKYIPYKINQTSNEIISDEVDFYAHCITKLGIKMNAWQNIGNSKEFVETQNILFRDTNDYGTKFGEKPIEKSDNWFVWRINDDRFTKIGKLESHFRDSFIGIVFNPRGIIELLKGNKYPINYPDYG